MFKKYFMTGLLVWVPIGVTVMVVRFLLNSVDQLVDVLPLEYRPETWLGYDIPGLGVLFVLLVMTLTGVLAANVMGRWFLGVYERILDKIPLVRSIYKGVKQSMTVLVSSQGQSFRQVVLMEYPRKGLWTLGLITDVVPESIGNQLHKDMVMIFVPTTPNPTSGFLVMAKRSEVKHIDMKVDEALKCIISLGTAVGPKEAEQFVDKTKEDRT